MTASLDRQLAIRETLSTMASDRDEYIRQVMESYNNDYNLKVKELKKECESLGHFCNRSTIRYFSGDVCIFCYAIYDGTKWI